jgi:metal-dependent amidase/aminoacylase/carboxypeptidase family protein
MVGCGIGLTGAQAMSELGGDVVLFAVPAEEYVEIEFRNHLREEGKLKYLGGKQELIYRGAFDDIDMAMMMHLDSRIGDKRMINIKGTNNGFIGKMARFIGKEAHAGGAPDKGINALNAATLAMTAVNAQRDTFRNEDYIRFHPIITKGGDLVNVVPADVRMESYVRGRTIDAILDANVKINRAFKAGAYALGAQVEILDLPGYLPLVNNETLCDLFASNTISLLGPEAVALGSHKAGSTDAGDLAHIMPMIHPYFGGVTGSSHARDFLVSDPEMAYIVPAKCMAMTVIDLLYDDAQTAEQILQDFQPRMTKDAYVAFMDSIGTDSNAPIDIK